MKPDDALMYMTVIGSIGTAVNVWISLSIRNSILTTKLWVTENFVGKKDLPQYLQFAESRARVLRTGSEP